MKPILDNPEKVILTVATTGGLHGKEANPNLPEQPAEIVRQFNDCYNAGASLAHIHVRDPRGRTSSNLDTYGEVLNGIMDRCPGMITQVGNGIGIWYDDDGIGKPFPPAERMDLLNLQPAPDMLTVNAGTFHFDHKGQEWLFDNSKKWNAEFINGCRERGMHNEIEVYDLSHIANMLELRDQGVLSGPLHFSFVLGIKGGIPATPQNLLTMLDAIPDDCSWQTVSIGRAQLALSTMTVALGGNVRVGLEDNVYYRRGELATGNAQLVERAVRIIHDLGREVATPEEARVMLSMTPPAQSPPPG